MLDSNAIGVAGEFIRSPKSMLGKGQPFYVGGRVVRPIDATGDVFKHLRKHAESKGLAGLRFDRAVVTIPVDIRGSARRELREAARIAGIAIEQFVHEPFAALYGYARRSGDPAEVLARLQGRHALVFDWGGGTLDLTLCERVGDILVQVQNVGNSQIGGDRSMNGSCTWLYPGIWRGMAGHSGARWYVVRKRSCLPVVNRQK